MLLMYPCLKRNSASLYLDDSPIAVHKLSNEKGKVITDPSHRRRFQTKKDKLSEIENSNWLIITQGVPLIN